MDFPIKTSEPSPALLEFRQQVIDAAKAGEKAGLSSEEIVAMLSQALGNMIGAMELQGWPEGALMALSAINVSVGRRATRDSLGSLMTPEGST